MKRLLTITLLLCAVATLARAEEVFSDSAAVAALKELYECVFDERRPMKETDSITQSCLTIHGRKAHREKSRWVDADVLWGAQDIDIRNLLTLKINSIGGQWFHVSYVSDYRGPNEDTTDIIVKVVKENGKYKIDDFRSWVDPTLTEENTVLYADGLVLPEFPGGGEALQAYLKKNVHYPNYAHLHKIEGRVVITFIVRKDGEIYNAWFQHKTDTCLDNEALRVIRNMPNWKPGTLNGEKVNVRYNIPIKFSL